MYSNIISLVKTKDDVAQLSEEIDVLLSAIFKAGDNGFSEVLNSQISDSYAREIENELKTSGLGKQEYLEGLKKELDKLGVIKLTVAHKLKGKSLSNIQDWVKTNVGGQVILEVETKPSIVGGAIVSYKGEYRDYSVRKKLESDANWQEIVRRML